jgi:hypothetical protein
MTGSRSKGSHASKSPERQGVPIPTPRSRLSLPDTPLVWGAQEG